MHYILYIQFIILNMEDNAIDEIDEIDAIDEINEKKVYNEWHMYEERGTYDDHEPIEYFAPYDYDLETLIESPNLYDITMEDCDDKNWLNKKLWHNYFRKNNEIWKEKRKIFLEKIQKETVRFYECLFHNVVIFCDLEDKTFYGRINDRSIRTYTTVKGATIGICDLFGSYAIEESPCSCDECLEQALIGYSIKYNMDITHRRLIDEIMYLLEETNK